MIAQFRAARCVIVLLLVTGCATSQRQPVPRIGDWEAEDAATARVVVPPAPGLEPAPVAPPPVGPPKIAQAQEPTETWVSLNRWCKGQGLAPPALLPMTPL